jgi:Fic family protein
MVHFLRFLAGWLIMVTQWDALLGVGLFPKETTASIARKMGKKPVSYNSLLLLLQKLRKKGLIQIAENRYHVSNQPKARELFWLLQCCSQNNIDYNTVVSQKAALFVRIGLEKGRIRGLLFDSKTVKRIVQPLSRNGFCIVESRKPFECIIVASSFTKRLARFFYPNAVIRCPRLTECIDEKKLDNRLEKQFSQFKRKTKKRITFDETGFIHASLSLEGNTLSLPETERLLKQNIPPASKSFQAAQQVLDYKKALDQFVYSGNPFSIENVLSFHATAMHSMAAGAGEIRKQNVRIKGNAAFQTPDWKEIPALLKDFFWQAEQLLAQKKLSAAKLVENAAFLHTEFQRIHPFIDGNSRTARAIFSKILVEKGFPLIKIPIGFADQYLQLTKRSDKREDPPFTVLMKQIVLESLKQADQELEYSATR